MGMLRSEQMESISIYFSKDTAKQTITELGRCELLHFKDLNTDVKKDRLLYAREIKHLEKILSRYNYLTSGIDNIEHKVKHSSIDQVEEQIDKYYFRLIQLKAIKKETDTNFAKMREDLFMMEETENFIGSVSDDPHGEGLNFVTGIVERDRKLLLKKVLHQALRRNLIIKTKDVEDNKKTVFIIFAHGSEAADKIKEIFTSMGGRILEDRRYRECKKGLLELTSLLSQIQRIRDQNSNAVEKEISKIKIIAGTWKYYLYKEAKIYKTLNKLNFDFDRDCLVGEAWVLKNEIPSLKKTAELNKGEGNGHFAFELIKSTTMPPTCFRLSKYAQGFQELTNVYGIPKYGEVNPAAFGLFTFPFLFGCMFGDMLHGLIVMGIALYFIKNFDKLNKKYDGIQILIEGRYVMFSAGLGAFLFGILYSDFGSVSLALFTSQTEANRTYPLGLDPAWHHSPNEMMFINSLKMKMAIVLGFFHMLLGVVISFINAIHFKEHIQIYGVLIPQTIIYIGFHGYLVFLIFYKWMVTSDHPSLISVLVGMYTQPFELAADEMYPGQLYVQLFIFSVILICLPWMIFVKPAYLTAKKMIKPDEVVEVWIGQMIHAIEFGIGLISNAASYLRLWAVSLAHAQLTQILHQFTLANFFEKPFFIPFYVVIYVAFTALLLLGMEGLGTALHALRLNWVEFHTKFFDGSGYLFKPLSFEDIDDDDDE